MLGGRAIAVGCEGMSVESDDMGLALDVQAILKQQRGRLKGIRVVSEATDGGGT